MAVIIGAASAAGRGRAAASPARAVLLALAALACARHEAPRALGQRLAEGEAVVVRASADGRYLAALRACRPVKDRTLPAGTAACELAVVPADGGPARPVAAGVLTLGRGFAWGGEGHALVALADEDPATSRGVLVVWTGGEPARVAAGVSYYALDRRGATVGWVADGQLFVSQVGSGSPVAVAGADGVATFEFGGKGALTLLARRGARAGGVLLAVHDRSSSPLAHDVRDYGFGADGEQFAYTAGAAQELAVAPADAPAHQTPAMGRDVQSFLFAPRGGAVAFIADAVPGRQGDLWVGQRGAAPVRLGQRVGEPRWAGGGGQLAWLQDYDPRSRTGTIAAGGPGRAPRSFARNVSDFDLTPDGSAIAYLVHETAGGYSVNLALARTGEPSPPSAVARGVFGFAFSPDARWLYYRTACTREAEACDLLRIPATGPAPGAQPERIAAGMKSFEFAPGRPDRLLLGFARKDRIALDLAVWDGGKLTAVDTSAVPGTAQFVGGDATRIAYAINDPARRGVYLARVP